MEIALFMVIAFSAFLFLAEPLFALEKEAAGSPSSGDPLPPGADGILDEIVDLDLERAAGKMSEESYATVRRRLVAEAAVALAETRPAASGEQAAQEPSLESTPDHSGARKICARCGSSAEADDRFCVECGNSLTSSKETT
jgi:hypothetical protein